MVVESLLPPPNGDLKPNQLKQPYVLAQRLEAGPRTAGCTTLDEGGADGGLLVTDMLKSGYKALGKIKGTYSPPICSQKAIGYICPT